MMTIKKERKWAAHLIKKRKHTDWASLYQIQTSLVVLVFDKGPLQPLWHIFLLGEAEINTQIQVQNPFLALPKLQQVAMLWSTEIS